MAKDKTLGANPVDAWRKQQKKRDAAKRVSK